MSNRLGGRQGTAYTGTNANQPPNWTFSDRNPTQYDIQNVSLGDMWLNKDNETIWVLVSLAGDPSSKGSLATWSQLDSNISNDVQTLTGNDNVVVGPDVNNNIFIKGDGIGITIVGDAGTNTLTASLINGSDFIETISCDAGSASPIAGVIDIKTDAAFLNCGSSVLFTGSTNEVVLNVTDASFNTVVGKNAGNLTMLGLGATDNNIFGGAAGTDITTGDGNVLFGNGSGSNLTTGSYNTAIGVSSGVALTLGDSSNICIGYNVNGITGDSNVLRIGVPTGGGNGSINRSFIQGIYGISPAISNPRPVIIDSDGQLGTGTGVAFFAYSNLDIPNVTGDGTPYIVSYDTESYDFGNNFASTIFTAPVDGIYLFSFGLDIEGISVLNTSGTMFLNVTGAQVFGGYLSNFGAIAVAPSGVLILSNTVQVRMVAGQTASVVLRVDASTPTVGLRGFVTSNVTDTYFSGVLIQ